MGRESTEGEAYECVPRASRKIATPPEPQAESAELAEELWATREMVLKDLGIILTILASTCCRCLDTGCPDEYHGADECSISGASTQMSGSCDRMTVQAGSATSRRLVRVVGRELC